MGKMGYEKREKNAVHSFIQGAPIKCNQVQDGIGFAILEASQSTKPTDTWRLC